MEHAVDLIDDDGILVDDGILDDVVDLDYTVVLGPANSGFLGDFVMFLKIVVVLLMGR